MLARIAARLSAIMSASSSFISPVGLPASYRLLNVVFHALDAAADDAQVFQDQTVRVARHGITLAEKG